MESICLDDDSTRNESLLREVLQDPLSLFEGKNGETHLHGGTGAETWHCHR
jgi:hypothetical protein